jgi:undecaprenyl-diphosphatase
MGGIGLYDFINIVGFHMVNSMGFEAMDPIMLLISNKFTFIPLYLYLLYLLYKNSPSNFIWMLVAVATLIFFADAGSVHLFKNQFEVLRPCYTPIVMQEMRFVTDCGGQYGFISSHASNSFAIAFFISLLLKSRKTFFWLFNWAALVGLSRVYLGVHFPYDVIGGMFWGLFVSLLVYKIFKSKLNETVR